MNKTERSAPLQYWTVSTVVGAQTYYLALHRTAVGWRLSDPVSGVKVLDVSGTYKGCPVSSKGMSQGTAVAHARAGVLAQAERHGVEEFHARLAAVRARVKKARA